jgi:hypothetical protein
MPSRPAGTSASSRCWRADCTGTGATPHVRTKRRWHKRKPTEPRALGQTGPRSGNNEPTARGDRRTPE